MIVSTPQQLWRHHLAFGLVVLVVLIGDFFGAWGSVRQLVEPLAVAIELPIVRLSQKSITTSRDIALMWQNSQKLAALELQYSQALFDLQDLQSVRAENRELRRMLENTDRTLAKTVITAPVISFARPALLVGEADGVVDQASVVSKGTLLGFVSQVGQKSSQVTLLAENDTKPLLVQTENGVQGLLVGDGREIRLTEVPVDAKVMIGERVTTVGQQGIAKNLVIGVVGTVESLPQDAVLSITIKQLVSFFTTDIVEVY
jgi:cell shape-determining protein MreC